MQFITPVEITPGTFGSWQTLDLSSYVPSGSTGVLLKIYGGSGAGNMIGWRKNGSTDDRHANAIYDANYFGAAIGCDGDRKIQVWCESGSGQKIWLMGYFGSEAVFFTNAVHKNTYGSDWADISIASDTGTDTAIGAFFEFTGGTYDNAYGGLRKKGSTDNYINIGSPGHCGIIIGVDANEKCQGWSDDSPYNCDFWLNGYLTAGATFPDNATDVSIATQGSYVDLPALPSGAIGGIYHVISSWSDFNIRKNGSSEDNFYYIQNGFFGVECDGSRLVEAKINDDCEIYQMGYFVPTSVDTNSERSAKVTGIDGSQSERWATITAAGIYNDRAAKIAGKDTGSSERSAKLEGTEYGRLGLKIAKPGHSVHEDDRYLSFNAQRPNLKFFQIGKTSATPETEIAVPLADIIELPIKVYAFRYNSATEKFSPVQYSYDENYLYFAGEGLAAGSYYYFFICYA